MLTLKLPQFEGPLDLLHALVQKEEIDIYSLELHLLVQQILQVASSSMLEQGAESMGYAGHLLWVKSKALLPKDEQTECFAEEESDFRLPFFEQLVEYCKFKEAARHLSEREEKAQEAYMRHALHPDLKKPLGIEHLSLNDLAALFQEVLVKAKDSRGVIEEEEWRVADKIGFLRTSLKDYKKIAFELIFSSDHSKLEMIVLFLAILEMIKLGEIGVMKEDSKVFIFSYD